MIWTEFKLPVYLILLVLVILLGYTRWPSLRKADRILVLLISFTFIQEITAYLCYKALGDNMFTYHFYSPVEFLLICLYFNTCNGFLRRGNKGIWLGVSGVILSILNSVYLQPLKIFNSYYLLFEGTFVIILCLLSFYEILLRDIMDFNKTTYFWFSLIFMFYWSVTYTGWGIFSLLETRNTLLLRVSEVILYVSNLLFYTSIGVVIFNYKKFSPSVT